MGSSCTVRPARARGLRDGTLGRHGQLQLDVLGCQGGREAQQRQLGAAGIGRLGHGEYA